MNSRAGAAGTTVPPKKRQVHHRIKKLIMDASLTAEAVVAYMMDAQPTGDYYTEGGSAPVLWLATARARTYFALGPAVGSRVNPHAMASLLRGRHPVTGAKIRKAGADGTMVGGIDVTINPAPKSVSVLWAVADDELRRKIEVEVYLAATRAITRMLDEVPMVRERYGPGPRDVRHVLAQDWVGVQALHTTARLTAHKGIPDPQLHVHNVLMGALDDAGRLRALDTLPMTRYHREMDAEATSALAETFRQMGFPIRRIIERKKSGAIKTVKWELDGIPPELLKAMSARSREIEDLKRQYTKATGREADGPGWERFLEQQRGPKAKLSPQTMSAAWHDESAEYGYTPDVHAALVELAMKAKTEGVEKRGRTGWAAEQLRREVLEELCREHAIVPRADLDRLLVQLSTGLIDPFTAMQVVAAMFGDGDLLATTDGMVTTLEVLAAEQRAERAAEVLMQAQPSRAADPAELEREYRRVEEEGAPFDERQREAVALATSGARLVSITGPAGTGKGHASSAMVAIWQRQGRRVIAAAVQGITAQQAQADSGADQARTLAGLQWDLTSGKVRLAPSDVVFVDEAGMIGHRLYAPLLEAVAEAGATLVQVGDDKQLSSIEAGGLWTVIHAKAAEVGLAAELEVIRRARNPEEAQAWTDLRDGRVAEALTWYRDQDLLRLYDTRAELLAGMLDVWWAAGPDRGVMVVDSSNEERDELNAMAQARRLAAGELGTEALTLENGREIRAGDRVLFDVIYYPDPAGRTKRVENGTRATVLSVDIEAGTAVLRLHEPQLRPPAGRRSSRSPRLEVAERELTVPVSAPLELGYARHVVKAQGMTADVANVATSNRTAHNELYVMISRSRDGTRIHALRAEVEQMGAEPEVLGQPAEVQEELTAAGLLEQVRARREAELSGLLAWERQSQGDRADHLFPAERLAIERERAEASNDVPQGATPLSDLFEEVGRERVQVPREDPALWAASRDQIAKRASRSTTKTAVGRRMYASPAEERDRQAGRGDDREEQWATAKPERHGDLLGLQRSTSPPRPAVSSGSAAQREPWPRPLPAADPIDTAARDHARWCDGAKVLAAYQLLGRLDIAEDPAEQAARRWLADPRAVIVVTDQEQEQRVRAAVARLIVSAPPASAPSASAAQSRVEAGEELSHAETLARWIEERHASEPPAAWVPSPAVAEYTHSLADLPPRDVNPKEPRVLIATAAYQERRGRRVALGLDSTAPVIEPDVEPRAYVVAPLAPGSGWSYREMTRALSAAGTTHLITPPLNETTARAANRERDALRESITADRRAARLRHADVTAQQQDAARRVVHGREWQATRGGAVR